MIIVGMRSPNKFNMTLLSFLVKHLDLAQFVQFFLFLSFIQLFNLLVNDSIWFNSVNDDTLHFRWASGFGVVDTLNMESFESFKLIRRDSALHVLRKHGKISNWPICSEGRSVHIAIEGLVLSEGFFIFLG